MATPFSCLLRANALTISFMQLIGKATIGRAISSFTRAALMWVKAYTFIRGTLTSTGMSASSG
jgi:hypothetical protein